MFCEVVLDPLHAGIISTFSKISLKVDALCSNVNGGSDGS